MYRRLSAPTLALMGHGDIESVAEMSGDEIAEVVMGGTTARL